MSTTADDTLRRHTFTVRDYYRMAEAGILPADARVELIEGEIIDMPPIGSRHAATVDRLARVLNRAAGDSVQVRSQNPVSLGSHSEPVPDFALLRPRPDCYESAHPGPTDILLIVEVSDSTLRYDRAAKAPLYARSGIPEYWIVDVEQHLLERYLEPNEITYGRMDRPGLDKPIAPVALPTLMLDLRPIFRAQT